MKYARSISVLFTVFLICASPSLAAECKYHNVKLAYSSFSVMDEAIEPYDLCYQFDEVLGTIGGHYVSCIIFAEWGTTNDVWGDGFAIPLGKYYSFFETPKGNLEVIDWVYADPDFGIESGISKIINGTGIYEGAYGTMMVGAPFPSWAPFISIEGLICTP